RKLISRPLNTSLHIRFEQRSCGKQRLPKKQRESASKKDISGREFLADKIRPGLQQFRDICHNLVDRHPAGGAARRGHIHELRHECWFGDARVICQQRKILPAGRIADDWSESILWKSVGEVGGYGGRFEDQ